MNYGIVVLAVLTTALIVLVILRRDLAVALTKRAWKLFLAGALCGGFAAWGFGAPSAWIAISAICGALLPFGLLFLGMACWRA